MNKKIAILGSGISGLGAAYQLKKLNYHVTLFEKNDYFGGHTNTIEIDVKGSPVKVDTGFLVHNDRTYPNLIQLFKELNLKRCDADMSLSVQAKADGIEWAGHDLSSLFSQRKNLISPKFWRMVSDILRFNRHYKTYLERSLQGAYHSLGEMLKVEKFSSPFINWYLIPMGASIWSTPASKMLDYPVFSFINFCENHGLLQISNRPQWKSLPGGTYQYVEKIIKELDQAFLNTPIESVRSSATGVEVTTSRGTEHFDAVISAVHAPINLKIMKNLPKESIDILSVFSYQENLAVVHSDTSVLPQSKQNWAAWNYATNHKEIRNDTSPVAVSYLINSIQPLKTEVPIIVTLNPESKISKDKIYREITYSHPVFDEETRVAQSRIPDIQGKQRIYFAGAWQGYGFHEDGYKSALDAVNLIKGRV